MTSTYTQSGCGYVDPDAQQEWNNTEQVAPGAYLTVQITGEQELVDQGSSVFQALSAAVTSQVSDLASARYVFTHQVERSVTVNDGDDAITATLTFQPTRRRDLRNGKSELSVLNALDRGLTLAHSVITAQATLAETLSELGPLGMFVMAMA